MNQVQKENSETFCVGKKIWAKYVIINIVICNVHREQIIINPLKLSGVFSVGVCMANVKLLCHKYRTIPVMFGCGCLMDYVEV